MRSLALVLTAVTFTSFAAAAAPHTTHARAHAHTHQLAARTLPTPQAPVRPSVDPYHDPAPQWPWDTHTEYDLLARLGEMRGLATSDVHVRSVHGAITLYGSVPDERTHTRVILAVNADPRTRVLRDELTIQPHGAIGGGPSALFAPDAEARVAHDPGAVGGPLRVETNGGVVTVAGRVATYDDADRVMNTLQRIEGVRAVRSRLEVNEGTVITVRP